MLYIFHTQNIQYLKKFSPEQIKISLSFLRGVREKPSVWARHHLQHPGVDGRIILKWVFKKWNGELWNG